MKKYTSRDLSSKRMEIKESLEKDGMCSIQWKTSNREIDVDAILIRKDVYDKKARKIFINKNR